MASATAMLFTIGLSGLTPEGINYFDQNIDYWKEKSVKPAPVEIEKLKPEEPQANQSFDWKPYLDPKHKEFFREGDYTPPEPFMEVMRNPSDDNLKNWFFYIEKKNELAARLTKRMQEFTATQSAGVNLGALSEKLRLLPVAAEDFQRFRFRMYFDSTCPHCKKMFGTLAELQDRGYFVEARQIDRGSLQGIASAVAISAASPDEVKKFRVESVPLLVVGDLKKQAVYRQSGYATAVEILSRLQQN